MGFLCLRPFTRCTGGLWAACSLWLDVDGSSVQNATSFMRLLAPWHLSFPAVTHAGSSHVWHNFEKKRERILSLFRILLRQSTHMAYRVCWILRIRALAVSVCASLLLFTQKLWEVHASMFPGSGRKASLWPGCLCGNQSSFPSKEQRLSKLL